MTDLRDIIRQWVRLDSEISALQLEVSKRKNEKKKSNELLIAHMKQNNIDCFKVQGGELVYQTKTVTKPINKKKMLELLTSFYKGNTDQAMTLNTFLLENRDTEQKEVLVRKEDKVPVSVTDVKKRGGRKVPAPAAPPTQTNPNSGIV